MNKRIRGILSAALAFIMAFVLWVPAYAQEGERKLTILHVNDVHAREDGQAYVSKLKKDREAAGETVLLLNAGDTLHGQPFATISEGQTIVEVMNAVGYDAMAPGNHDFNYGVSRLLTLSKGMDFPLLSANTLDKATGEPVFEPYAVKELSGLKVGLLGLTTPETATKTNPKNVADVTFGSPAEAAQKAVDALQEEGVDVIIAIAHLGLDNETLPANRSDYLPQKVEGIDVIIDGHSHTVLENGKTVSGTLIAQTGEYLNSIGVVELTLSDGDVTSKTASLLPVSDEEGNPLLPADESIVAVIDEIKEKNTKITAEVIGKTAYDLQGEREQVRMTQTNLADLITEAMLAETDADIAFTNGGGIRASIPAGDITKGDVLTVLPFGNYIVAMDIKGSDILAALENGVSNYPDLAGSYSQVAGIRFTFDPTKDGGSRITEVILEKTGEALDPAKTYRVATNDFLASGGDGYTMFGSTVNYNEYAALDEAVISYIQSGAEITKAAKGRVTAAASEVPELKVQVEGAANTVLQRPEVVEIRAEMPIEVIKAPPAPVPVVSASGGKRTYTVQKGDTLWGIAHAHASTWQKLTEINNLNNPHLIYPGQLITVE